MMEQGFGAGHVFVRFHPGVGGHLPAPFGNAMFDFFHQARIVLFHDFIHRRLGLHESEVRVFLHHVQHRPEGGQGGGHRLLHSPHPVHVDMGMGNVNQIIGLGLVLERQQGFFRCIAGAAAQGPVPVHGFFQDGKRLVNRFIAAFLQPGHFQGEMNFRQHPRHKPSGGNHARFLFRRDAEGVLKEGFFPVSARLLREQSKALGQGMRVFHEISFLSDMVQEERSRPVSVVQNSLFPYRIFRFSMNPA